MDVDKTAFYPLLLDILTDISEAHFVSFDLELSGVCSKQIRGDYGTKTGKPTLQERYLETKQAAERYQILQFGLTCVTQDVESGKYILKPYNFDLNPLIEERGLDVERIWSYQSGAVEFLMKVGFDLNRPFRTGVPYLSRNESKEAKDKHAARNDKSSIADIQIKPTETESIAFVENVRQIIKRWQATGKPDYDYVNIPQAADRAKDTTAPPEELSRFEKRLVHQLVRADFPELVTISRKNFVQIVRYDKEREDKIAADRRREMYERVNRQKGFRWIIEAMLGSNISQLDLREVAKDWKTGESIFCDMHELKNQFDTACTKLRDNPRMIVGHNCFLDLVYIYRHFIGHLPETVEEFQRKLHALWPNIVDTKYMSTHNCGDINPVSSLDQIAAQLSTQATPVLDVPEEHSSYTQVEAFHEAGYDSYLTAQIAVRLSSKLEQQGSYVSADSAATTNGITNGTGALKLTEDNLSTHNGGPLVTSSSNWSLDPAPPTTASPGFIPSQVGGKWKRNGDPTVAAKSGEEDPFSYNPRDLQHRHRNWKADLTIPGGMPRLSSDFWRVYGNKLRVFGTEEGMCMLAGDEVDTGGSEEEGMGQGGVKIGP
ncbi:CAF1-domain-containing protein [Teratosphaeria nubilosa]|uniref:CAF1-domain-containing protein n=1 Tax=Teratosphaeria nubilosa TaxID=161662 RepID=A0A6G1L0L6_9PEZI|nr:CAF1-domain-containing protein [Teratosphaeria nubilosa]